LAGSGAAIIKIDRVIGAGRPARLGIGVDFLEVRKPAGHVHVGVQTFYIPKGRGECAVVEVGITA
jgi:hypothetical protein